MRKIVSVFLLLSLLMVACGKDEPVTATSKPTVEKIPQEELASTEAVVSVEEPEPVEEMEALEEEMQTPDLPSPGNGDPAECLIVSEEEARTFGGVYLRRGETLYTLALYAPARIAYDYGVGLREPNQPVGFNFNDADYVDLYTYSDYLGGTLAYGDIPAIEVQAGDEIISYGDTTSIELTRIDDVTYGICIRKRSSDNDFFVIQDYVYDPFSTHIDYKVDLKQFEIRDSNGNLVDEYYDLNRGEDYTVSWFDGTTYYEQVLNAKCRFYFGEFLPDYEAEGYLHKEGYASYNLSELGLTPGIYRINKAGFIEIK